MAAQYHSIFTEKGLELLRESIQSGTKLGITHMSFGDGNGALPTPNAAYTGMVKEVYRTQLNRLAPSKENDNWLEADGVIPSAVGGFNIREVGLWAGNTMVAYANYPPTYKPSGDQGTAQIKTIRIVLQIDNTANFELKIDASIVMATIQAVEDAKNEIYKNTVNTVKNISELLNLEVWDGRIVNVISYESDGLGGDFFTYDSTQANVNNGITIFNGWMRDLSDNYISTLDAGLKEDGTNHSDRFQLLLNCLSDNMTLEVFGKHLVNTAMLVTEKHNITVKFAEGAVLSAKELRDTFIFKGYQGQMPGSGARGILHFHNCVNPKVIAPKIIGCQKHNLNSPEPWEDGDAGVGFSFCKNPFIEHGDISHTVAWGILAEGSTGSIAQFNKIKDVLRQSGISIVINGGSNGKCLFNTISNVALYGIEWETYTDSTQNQSIGNIIENCQKGEAAVGNILELDSNSNSYSNCIQAINSENSDKINSISINFHNNKIYNCRNGSTVANCGIVKVSNNHIERKNPQEYYITSAYDTFLTQINNRSFYVLGRSSITIGSIIKIEDEVFDVLNIEEVNDPTYKSGTLKIVTVNKDLIGIRDMTQIYSKITSWNTNAFYTAGNNRDLLITGNTIKGYPVCFKTDSNNLDFENYKEILAFNSFINCENFLEMNGNNFAFEAFNNDRENVGESIGLQLIQTFRSALKPKGSFNVFQKYSNDTPSIVKNFSIDQYTCIVGAIISFPRADASTTGNLVLRINGLDTASINNDQFNNTYNKLIFLQHLGIGNHTVSLASTVGDLQYSEGLIKFIYA